MNPINIVYRSVHVIYTVAMSVILLLACQQQGIGQNVKTPFWNKQLEKIAKPESKIGWIEFRDDVSITRHKLFTEHREAFKLSTHDEMQEKKVLTDITQSKHYRYDQYHKGVPILGAEFIVHEDPHGKATRANGRLAEALDLDIKPALTEKAALTEAFKYINVKDGLWNKPDQMEGAKLIKASTYFPKGILSFCRKEGKGDMSNSNLALVWTFELSMAEPSTSVCISIDAKTGRLVDQYPLEMKCDDGTVATPWYGTRALNVDRQVNNGQTSFVLLDNCTDVHSFSIHTFVNNGNDLQEIRSNNTRWSDTPVEIAGGTTHWGIHQAIDYYRTAHGRNSWDDENGDIIAYVDPGVQNAFWTNSNRIRIGLGSNANSTNDDFTALDVVGHEFTHGVTKSSAGLVYRRESGALNESFSDIFGELIEHRTLGSNTWIHGGDGTGGGHRNMANPRAYSDNHWIDTENCTPSSANDQCGVHTNSGVQNYWFYLLCEGGSGTNYFGDQFDVEGIGMRRAAEIVYLALTAYMYSDGTYIDARNATLYAAEQLYGSCSNEAIQVGRAWFAVNVGSDLSIYDTEVCGNQDDGFFRGINSVTAGGSGCSTSISATAENVTFGAGNFISLRPGFRAVSSGEHRFLAYIRPCSFAMIPPPEVGITGVEPSIALASKMDNPDQELDLNTSSKALAANLVISPNPLKESTQIQFELAAENPTSLDLYDLNGRLVRNLYRGQTPSGKHQLTLDAKGLSPGIYICRMISGDTQVNSRLVISQ